MDTPDSAIPNSNFSKTKELYQTPELPSGFYAKAVDVLVHGFISSNEDWNSRRLRYNVKKYGNIKTDKLACSESRNQSQANFPEVFQPPSLRRQVSLMTQIGTPVPMSPGGVATYRNSALRTLSYLFLNSGVLRNRSNDASSTEPEPNMPSDSNVIMLPAGTIVSSPTAPMNLKTHIRLRELDAKNPDASHGLPIRFINFHRRSLSCASIAKAANPVDPRYHSSLELDFLPKHCKKSERPFSLPLKEKRLFFPSSHTSPEFRTSYFADMAKDINLEEARTTDNFVTANRPTQDELNLKLPVVRKISRLSLLRPPPLDLLPQIEDGSLDRQLPLTVTDGLIEQTRTNEVESAVSSPFIIRPRFHNLSSTPMSAFSPLVLSHLESHNTCLGNGQVVTNRRRRQKSRNFFARYFRRNPQTSEIFRQVDDDMLDYRPFFTYMLSFVQILVMILACVGYGFTPIGINLERIVTAQLMTPSLTIEKVCRVQDENIWIGPQQADLIRLGARYAPCMRPDATLHRVVVEAQKDWDRHSGCCIRNEGDICYQTSRLFCSRTTSSWMHHGRGPSLMAQAIFDPQMRGRFGGGGLPPDSLTTIEMAASAAEKGVGPVCGQDPEFCEEPRSTGPFVWSQTDVTEWPICTKPVNASSLGSYAPHMLCEVVARPCCVGLKGECILTTSEHCSFLNGRYHKDARLCSQIHCLQDVCGMVPFVNPNKPDQISRLLVSLFLHAGIAHLVFSLFIQLTVMRHMEKLLGCFRVAVIFLCSGCLSGLASGIMLPYHVNTGPTGAHFALFGVSLVDSMQALDIFVSPWSVILKQAVLVVLGVFVGFLPWLDNYAHISGFVSGVLLAYAFVPYLGYGSTNRLRVARISTMSQHAAAVGDSDLALYANKLQLLIREMRRRKAKVVVGCLGTWVVLFALLLTVFINWPLTNCPWCKFLNCLPWTPNLCNSLEVNVHAPTQCINPRT